MNTIFETDKFKWINIQNPTKQELNEIASQYSFQKLTIDDSLEPGHLPKYESDDENISFLLVRFFDKEHRMLKNTVREFSHKISIYIGANFIITVHQKETDIFDLVLKKYIQNDYFLYLFLIYHQHLKKPLYFPSLSFCCIKRHKICNRRNI